MGRVVILMGLVSVVAVVYALMPAEYEPPPESAAKVASEAPAPEVEKAPPAPPKKAELPRVKPMPRPALKTPSKADDALAVGDDEEALTEEEKAIFKPLPPPPLEAPKQTVFPTAPQPAWTKKHGRDPATPMPVLSIQPIKRSVRAFYGNLPKGGRMPARIEIQEVLPLSVIEAINVPPESQLTMLGPFDTSVPSGLTEILNISEQHEGIFGVSVITPNGEKHREYIKTKP